MLDQDSPSYGTYNLSVNQLLKNAVRQFLATRGRAAIKLDRLDDLFFSASVRDAVSRWTNPSVPPELGTFILGNMLSTKSPSQLQQDLLAQFICGFSSEKSRTFVEFGACDGLIFSNTYTLERDFGWSGLLAEPALQFHRALRQNRSCLIETRCIWEKSGELLTFSESSVGEYSSILGLSSNSRCNETSHKYKVETISLDDALKCHLMPRDMSFLSVDTEGSEWEIIRTLDFGKYRFDFIAIEHNYSDNRERVLELLTTQGYRRVLTEVSDFDDWYVDTQILQRMNAVFGNVKLS